MDRNYEQEYKKAFEAAKGLHDAGNALTKKQMEIVFPQLAESEDERIRKNLVALVEAFGQGKYKNEMLAYLEKQKEQKPIIQDVELNDAVYDYVRDHFIAGADFTPEYIKKLMENAFFAGVDYYLLKQESESCEPDTNVEKVIEDVIRVYGKTQGEWVGGYDVDTLIVNLRRAFNKKEQKPTEWSEEDSEMMMRIINQVGGYTYFAGMDSERVVNWLKSIRPVSKESLQSWKPSEEQMKALLRVVDKARELHYSSNSGYDEYDVLRLLYKQLKEL